MTADTTGPTDSASGPVVTDQGPIVDSIIIDNRNIFDTEDPRYRHFVFKLANKLHYKTRAGIIRRELLFQEGQPFSYLLSEETARNLRDRLPLFDAWIEVDTLPNGHLKTRVVTVDEWTLSMGPNISREGNEYRYQLSATERNFLGRNQLLSAGFVIQERDDNYVSGRLSDQRFLGKPVQIDVRYSGNPVDEIVRVSAGHPYYSLTQKAAFAVDWIDTRARRDIYSDTLLVARSRSIGEGVATSFTYRTGTYLRKLFVTGLYRYRHERTGNKEILTDDATLRRYALAGFPRDSTFHTVGLGYGITNLDFAKLRQIDGLGYTEDFALGQTALLAISRAFVPGFKDHVYDNVSLTIAQGYRIHRSLWYLIYRRFLWFRGDESVRRRSDVEACVYNQRTDYLTLAAAIKYYSDKRSPAAEGLVLDGTTGIRGYQKYFRTGDRRATINSEVRLFPGLEILSVTFSQVLFLDAGRTWKPGESLSLTDMYFSGGIGLRIGLGHSSRNRVVRLDVVYSEKNGWEISIGTNQYFLARDASFALTSP